MSANHRDVPSLTIASAAIEIGHFFVKIDKKTTRTAANRLIYGGVEMEPTWSAVGVIGLSTRSLARPGGMLSKPTRGISRRTLQLGRRDPPP
jgi:hypothetical protein